MTSHLTSNDAANDADLLAKFHAVASKTREPVGMARVVIGCNGCLDLVVRAVPLLEALQLEAPPPGGSGASILSITNTEDLQGSFGHFFSNSAAAERTVENPKLMERLVETAGQIQGLVIVPPPCCTDPCFSPSCNIHYLRQAPM